MSIAAVISRSEVRDGNVGGGDSLGRQEGDGILDVGTGRGELHRSADGKVVGMLVVVGVKAAHQFNVGLSVHLRGRIRLCGEVIRSQIDDHSVRDVAIPHPIGVD